MRDRVFKLGPAVAVAMLALSAATAAADLPPTGSAAALYQRLQSVGLDATQVFEIRDAALDRGDVHITLTGTIAFSEPIEGRVTAAFFEGDGEILVVPPDQVERGSLALFTGAAILEEQFGTAFFRFDDDTFRKLQPYLRPPQAASEFVERWNPVARSLANADALNLLQSFTFQPPPGVAPRAGFFHARLGGDRLGNFDVFLSNTSEDDVVVGQVAYLGDQVFYNIWTAFPSQTPGKDSPRRHERKEPPLRITSYKIATQVMPPRELEADAVLDCMATQSGPRTVIFELSRYLQVRSVWLGTRRVEFIQNPALEGTQLARRGNDTVAIVLPEPLAAGSKLRLHFTYSGSVLSEAGGGLMYVGARGTWYPKLGTAMADFDLEFRYPAGWTLVATGKRTSQQTVGVDQVAHWISERPIPLAGFNLGRYVSVQATSGAAVIDTYAARGMESTFPTPTLPPPVLERRDPLDAARSLPAPLPATGPPPLPSEQARAVAERTARAVDFFARRFGPYPYSSLELTQMPGKDSQGWPGLVFLSSYAFLAPAEQTALHMSDFEKIVYHDLMPAHEAAHQWWGDLITWNSYHDLWIAEALANYSALLAFETRDAEHFRFVMRHYRNELLRPNSEGRTPADAGPVTLGPRLSSSRFPGGYEGVLYGRGTWLFHMLRYILRDPPTYGARRAPPTPEDPDARFYRALRTLCERFGGRALSTADLQKVFEQELPASAQYEGRKSLDWFFDGWVNGTAIPRLEITAVKFSTSGRHQVATGTLTQREAPENLVTLAPIYAVAGSGTVLLGRIFADGPKTSFRFNVPLGTRKLLVDPYGTILSRSRAAPPPRSGEPPQPSAAAPDDTEE